MAADFGLVAPPSVVNEPVRGYAPGSPERAELKAALGALAAERPVLPLVIGGKEVRTSALEQAHCPHDHTLTLADVHLGGAREIAQAIAAAHAAWRDWGRSSWRARAAVFLKAAELLAGPWRARLNAATMLGQSKTAHQAEIDAAAELADFWRFNVHFAQRIYAEQPVSAPGCWNELDYRPLEGFVYAVTPFNFTAIAGNLPSAPALMGNVVVWKPSAHAKLSAYLVLQILREAGLPDGVINLVYGDAAEVTAAVLADETLAGIHFTGSTQAFDAILAAVAARRYRAYPRIVGETGGKNFILAHASADIDALACAIIRGAFEYQGQKCSAASRLFIPRSLWPRLRALLVAEIGAIRTGPISDFANFMGAVINEQALERHEGVFARARRSPDARVLAGGQVAREEGWFVSPTLIETEDAGSFLMREEFFGPIAAAHVYDDARYEDVMTLIDETSAYGLTGAVFASDRGAVRAARDRLRHAAGNFYVNDKPTGAVVGQQPFGGARASGTNDKAGSMWNLMRWVSPRTLKETFDPARAWLYPFMEA